MKDFKDLHPVLQLQKLNHLYWDAVEGGNEQAIDEFNKLRNIVSDNLLEEIDQSDVDPYLLAHFIYNLPPRVLDHAPLCIVSGLAKRRDELLHFSQKGTEGIYKRWRQEAEWLTSVIRYIEVTITLKLKTK